MPKKKSPYQEDPPPVEKSQEQSSHRTFSEFLGCVRELSIEEREAALTNDTAWMVLPLDRTQELYTADGKEPLKYVWDHWAEFKAKEREAIQAYFVEHLNGEHNRGNIIANAVWSCLSEHSEERESDDGRFGELKQETQDSQAEVPATPTQSEEQGAPDPQGKVPATTNETEGPKLELQEVAVDKDREGGTPQQERKFHPNQYGGKELCIVVSYNKAGKNNLDKLAKILTHKGKIKYDDYGDAEEWHRKNYATFKSHLSKLRRKAKDKGWWDAIPPDYHLSYS